MPAAPQLPEELHARVAVLSERGDRLAEAGNYNAAAARYREALALLPAPPGRYGEALWLYGAIADAHFHQGDWEGCRENMQRARDEARGTGNAFVELRLGQAHFELKQLDAAEAHLFEAFRAGGEALFRNEAPRYLFWLRERVASED